MNDQKTLVFEIYRGDQHLRTERIARDIVKIGNLPTSHLQINDPQVSGIHAVIEVSGDEVHCIDLGSAFGTKINGERINKAQLRSGDVLEFGMCRVVFTVDEPKPAMVAAAAGGGRPPRAKPSPYRYVRMVNRPSDTRHYSRRFLSQPSRTDGTIEVAHIWRDHVMTELAMKAKDKAIFIGPDQRNDIIIDDPSLEDGLRYPLVTRAVDGTAYLHLKPDMKGDVYIDSNRFSVADALKNAGPDGLRITPKTRARIVFGENIVYVHQGTRPKLVLPAGAFETHLIFYVLASALIHGFLLAAVFLWPVNAGMLDIDSFELEDTFVDFELIEEEPEPEPLPELEDLEGDDEEDLAAMEAGESGRAGAEDAEETDNRRAIEGNLDPDEQVTLDERRARELASERGVVSFFNEVGGPQSIFGTVAQGYDPVTADGYVFGATIGENAGLGGLGLSGGGISAGGNSPGGFGRGRISLSRPGRREARERARRLSRIDDRDGRDIDVELGRPSVEGHLDREVIRRVMREHRREIRDCYQREFQRNPDLHGRVVVSFTIDPTGRVARARISESDLNNSNVEDCVVRRVERFVFPQPTTPGLVHVNYPFVFTEG
jgi:TonB family protein